MMFLKMLFALPTWLTLIAIIKSNSLPPEHPFAGADIPWRGYTLGRKSVAKMFDACIWGSLVVIAIGAYRVFTGV